MVLVQKLHDGRERFTDIGNSFYFYTKGSSFDEFENSVRDHFGSNPELARDCYGFVMYEDGRSLIPLHTEEKNHVINSAGQKIVGL